MISVPEAGLFPRTPRPVWFMNGSMTSSGNPCGYDGNAVGVTMPMMLPVAGGRVLALRALEQPARDRRRPGLRRAALERHDVPEPERLEIRQVEAADGAGEVAEGVGAFVSVLRRIRQLTCADGVEHDHARPRHVRYSMAALDEVLGLLALAGYIVAIVGLAAAITFVVDQDLPDRAEPEEGRGGRGDVQGREAEPATSEETPGREPLPPVEARTKAALSTARLRDAAASASSSGVYSSPCASATASYVILPADDVDAARERRDRGGSRRARRGPRAPRRTAA